MADARVTSQFLGGRYRLRERLAGGGMGEVWRADDERMERPVAVKILRDDLSADPAALTRFRREARTAAALSHPNVAAVLDVIESDPPAIVMELVDGQSLAHRLRSGPLPIDEALAMADGLLAALGAAHAAGVVHRDVTPGNVLLATGGSVKVTDFGIARTDEEVTRLTDTGTVVGTASYLAPEQLAGETASPATDQYAAGLVLYEALTGVRPFHGPTAAAQAVARLHTGPVPIRDRRPEIPGGVAEVVMRALARDPADRFPSVAALRTALVSALGAGGRGPLGPQVSSQAPALDDATTVRNLPAASGATAVLTDPVSAPRSGRGRPRRRADPRRALVALAAVLGLVLAAAFVARAVDGPGTVEVPSLAGEPLDEAREFAGAADLRLRPDTVDSVEPEGTVLSQSVPPGTRVEGGTVVEVDVSSGVPPCCTVPSVIDLPLDAARQALAASGLTVGSITAAERDRPEGTVVAQHPDPGATVDRGTPVDLLTATGDEDDGEGNGEGNGNGKGRGKGDDD